jgi:hypothetical protein
MGDVSSGFVASLTIGIAAWRALGSSIRLSLSESRAKTRFTGRPCNRDCGAEPRP